MATKTYQSDLKVKSWKQFDSSWASLKTSCGGTMKSEGCFITSVAMIFHSFGDSSITPKTLMETLKAEKKADCPFNWYTAATKYKHTYKGKSEGTFDKLKGQIFNFMNVYKVPIMIHVPKHLVVATGFKGTLPVDANNKPDLTKVTPAMILVNDPGSSNNSTLADVIKQRGAVEYYVYYTK